MAIKIGEKKYQNFQKKYRNNQMVFVKQKKKTMRYKNFLSDNFFKFTIRAVCRNPRRYQYR